MLYFADWRIFTIFAAKYYSYERNYWKKTRD
jgi:hypothetical protein